MSTIKLFHVSSTLRDSLVVKTAKNYSGADDYSGVYFSFSMTQAALWAKELTQSRGTEFQYFYEVEVDSNLLYQKGVDNIIPWQGEEIEEVIYVGPNLTNLNLLSYDFYWDGYDCYLNGEKIEYPEKDYEEDILLCPELSDEEIMALVNA